jgi:hypothetical protein
MTHRNRICEALVLSAVLAMGCGGGEQASDDERKTMSTTVDWLNNTGYAPRIICDIYDPQFTTNDNGECGLKNSQREECVQAGDEQSLFIEDYGHSRRYVCAKSRWLVKDTYTADFGNQRSCQNAVASDMLVHDTTNQTSTVTTDRHQAICCSSNQCGEILKGSIAGQCFGAGIRNSLRNRNSYVCGKDGQNIAKWYVADEHPSETKVECAHLKADTLNLGESRSPICCSANQCGGYWPYTLQPMCFSGGHELTDLSGVTHTCEPTQTVKNGIVTFGPPKWN